MAKTGSCEPPSSQRYKSWPYYEYYIGERDDEKRRNGQGENYWSGVESLESYTGNFVRNTMHGFGDYRFRLKGEDGTFFTYEGHFYANSLHGYGRISYPDGRTFTGIFYKNVRFGPGVETSLSLQTNVGFWYDSKLVRLSWLPAAPSILPDFCTGPAGPEFVEPFRKILSKTTKIIGQTNSAIELLKQYGADPMTASQKWTRLYSKFCTDLQSELCYVDAFDQNYYRGEISTLEVVSAPKIVEPVDVHGAEESEIDDDDNGDTSKNYFAWNNSDLVLQMMQHCYKHEKQRKSNGLDLFKILNGPRKRYRPSDKYEKHCRTLLMASYLGHIVNVAQLVNDDNVYPDVADLQGNTALMYAAVGDQAEIIHFLIEAGANVNSYNDSCCTALGAALTRYLCVKKNVVPSAMVQCLLPPAAAHASKDLAAEPKFVSEWLKSRTNQDLDKDKKSPAKIQLKDSSRRTSGTFNTAKLRKSQTKLAVNDIEYDSDESFSEDKRLYTTINTEYVKRVNDIMSVPNAFGVNYLFEVHDMIKDVLLLEDTLKPEEKVTKKGSKLKPKMSIKMGLTTASIIMEVTSTNSIEKLRDDMMAKVMLTILQLLIDGADPKLVVCPQPALYMAVLSGCSDLVRHLVRHGADINAKYPDSFNYTTLDIAISRPLNLENLDVIRAILECGADTNHRLYYTETHSATGYPIEIPGPTLIHAVLAKQTDFQFEDEIRNQLIKLLLAHNCDPTVQFKGRSAVDVAMMKKIDLIDIFMKNPNVNLNAIINSKNQTILVKMFDINYFQSTAGMDRFPILTNLLLYGADPLIECKNEDEEYRNVFAFANKVLSDITPIKYYPVSTVKDVKTKKEKSKSSSKVDVKVKPKAGNKGSDEQLKVAVYQEAIDLMKECARLLHIRWIQAKLMKELIVVIYKYKHRPWSMIFKEHKNPKSTGLWLTTPRCLEIWDILKTTKKKMYTDDRILKRLLCIVQFYNKRLKGALPFTMAMTAAEKNIIESDVSCLITEHKIASKLAQEAEAMKKNYVKPELAPRKDKRFNICFECALPIIQNEEKSEDIKETSISVIVKEMPKSGLSEHSKLEPDKLLWATKKTAVDEFLPFFMSTENFLCPQCELVRFCNSSCLRINVDRVNCHPCSEFLKSQYFQSPIGAESPLLNLF